MGAESAPRKIFAGPRLKRLRRERRLTQARMADELDVSPSYLNLMESNQRPITSPVLTRLTEVYGLDPRDFAEIDGEQSADDIEQILADPLFHDASVPRTQMREAAENAAALVAAMLKLYRAYAAARETSDTVGNADGNRDEPPPGEETIARVGAILQQERNYFFEIDAAAELLVAGLQVDERGLYAALADYLRSRHGVRLRPLQLEAMGGRLRWYDHHRKQLMLSEILDQPGRTFQAAYQVALTEFSPLLDAVAARLTPADEAATRKLLRVTLANYFAAAVMMPYDQFYEAAELTSYDVEVLAARFGASFEQVAHRLTTLSRETARGVPFFMLRIDIAGNVSKRLAPRRFLLAQSGGSCPLWNIHASFTEPNRILTQVVELTDGSQWFSIARATQRPVAAWGAIQPRFAIVLGCELRYARQLVYTRSLDLDAPEPTPIGVGCRQCDRPNCLQRAAPPARRQLVIDELTRNVAPFPFKDI
ncbi:helix-turn-helix domain-containing protein [Methylocella silvestris]|uniref:XRE family transcriptional regulator n=1 Tax=Methylocella silvestris TaxID=199596 RepID=A0A2J7TF83_METSI|nr:short-chain fatty acyl-CoA regulator family protein [Methylocella silvestris]PNG25430.1 XRE family transcriptional regulator [Methylocella silvestris]